MRATWVTVLHSASPELRVLKIQHALAEGLALFDEVQGDVERTLHADDGGLRDVEPLLRQLVHELEEPLAFLFAQPVADGHAAVFEKQLAGIGSFEPHLLQIAAAPEARIVFGFDSDQGNTAGLFLRVGLRHHDDEIRLLPVGDVGFGTVDHVVVAVTYGGGAHRLQIGAGVGLGHGDRADHVAARHLRQPALLLLFVAVMFEVGGYDRAVHLIAPALNAQRQHLLHDHGVVPVVTAAAAVGQRHFSAQKSAAPAAFQASRST